MRKSLQNESGHTVVEATIVYPVAILTFFVLFYASVYLCQRANLQANLEDALIYYKNLGTDTYVTTEKQLAFEINGSEIHATGNRYETPEKLDPYRHIFQTLTQSGISEGDFQSFFRNAYSHMFFDDGTNIQVTIEEKNYLLYRKLTATATQHVQTAVNIAFIGASNSMDITSQATVVVVDGDDMIRDIDFAGDMLAETAVGKAVSNLAQRAVDFYNNLKTKLNI